MTFIPGGISPNDFCVFEISCVLAPPQSFRARAHPVLPKISTLPLSEECALATLHSRSITLIHGIGPLCCWCSAAAPHPLRCCSLYCCPWSCHSHCLICTAAPSQILHHVAHSTATANCCTATQWLRSKQMKYHYPILDRQVSWVASHHWSILCCCSALSFYILCAVGALHYVRTSTLCC